jgi:hypothetical protein
VAGNTVVKRTNVAQNEPENPHSLTTFLTLSRGVFRLRKRLFRPRASSRSSLPPRHQEDRRQRPRPKPEMKKRKR